MYGKNLRMAHGSLGNNQGTFYNSEVIEPSFWTKHALATTKGQEADGSHPLTLFKSQT